MDAQSYIDKHEDLFDKIKVSKAQTIREDQTNKQDSRFYNEDGTKDTENFPTK